jgi:hypothetical protein
MVLDGAVMDGTDLDGTDRDGAAPDGTDPDGTDPDGVGIDRTDTGGVIKSMWLIFFSHIVMEARIRSELAAYDRTCRASLAARNGPLTAPVLQLSEVALAALFAPAAYENLVARPLKNKQIQCERKE